MSRSPVDAARIAREYLGYIRELLGTIDVAAIERAVQIISRARERGSAVYIAGNGGSAAAASHFATDLSKATRSDPPLRVVSLTDNGALITAISNDEGYERIFVAQLESLLQQGDVLIVISASGNSQNVLRAVDLARERGAASIALVGFDGGALAARADVSVHVASTPGAYGPAEDALLSVHHVIADCLARQ